MSVGDVVQIGNKLYMVDLYGFKEIDKKATSMNKQELTAMLRQQGIEVVGGKVRRSDIQRVVAMGCDLKGTNLLFYGFGRDADGSTRINLAFPHKEGFSIYTEGNLPKIHRLVGKKPLEVRTDFLIIRDEAVNYIKKFGTPAQKASLKEWEIKDRKP